MAAKSTDLLSIQQIANVKTWAHRRNAERRGRRKLWDEAFAQLPASEAAQLEHIPHVRPTEVKETVQEKLDESEKKAWKYTRSNGDIVLFRTVLQNVLKWVKRFEGVMDTLVSNEISGHAAAPWALLKLLLNTAFNSLETRNEIVEAMEYTSKIIALYAEVELFSLGGKSRLKSYLATALVSLYTSVLSFFAKTRSYLAQHSAKRFAKGILAADTIVAEWVNDVKDAEQEVIKVRQLADAEEHRTRLVGLQSTLDTIKMDMLKAQLSDSSRRDQLKRWLDATLTDDTLQHARTSRHANTCDWILKQPLFAEWLRPTDQGKAKLFWLHGGPGFGKTVLAARIVDHLSETASSPLASFFVVSENESRCNLDTILRSWIFQIVDKDLDALENIYSEFKDRSRKTPGHADLWDIFGRLVRNKRYIFTVDGFDECTTVGRESKYQTHDARSQFLRALIDRCHETQASFLIVSRDQDDIRRALGSAQHSRTLEFSQYGITSADTKTDVVSFSRAVTGQVLSNKSKLVQDEVAGDVAERADGLFLWVHLLRQKLSEECGQNAKRLRAIVKEMPEGIDEAYAYELARLSSMKGYKRDRAMAVLRWVSFAARPMTVKELTEALALDSESAVDAYPADELPDEWAERFVDDMYVNSNIRSYCGCLVELKSSGEDAPLASHTVHFVHFSVKEFLLRPISGGVGESKLGSVCFADPPSEHERLADTCLRYLCYEEFGRKSRRTKKSLHLFPFLRYAANSWYHHASAKQPMSEALFQSAEKLFDPTRRNWQTWSEVFEAEQDDHIDDDDSNTSSDGHSDPHPDIVQGESSDSERESDLDESDRSTGTGSPPPLTRTGCDGIDAPGPIYYAAWLGLTDIVKSLQRIGLTCDIFHERYGTPLQAAVASGREEVAAYLIDQKVDVNQPGARWGSAICAAVNAGSLKMMRSLVDAGADLDSRDSDGRTLLHMACSNGDARIVEALLQTSAAESKMAHLSNLGQAPLHEAAASGNLAVVKLLLNHNADPDICGLDDKTPLWVAASTGNEEVARSLLRCTNHGGVDVSRRSSDGFTALDLACFQGLVKTVSRLLDHPSASRKDNLNATDAKICFPRLLPAVHAEKSAEAIVRRLISSGADVNATDGIGSSMLIHAVANEAEEVVKLLIESGADPNMNAAGATPLDRAVTVENISMVKTLLAAGADITSMTVSGHTPLDCAVKDGNQDIVSALLSHGALTPYIPSSSSSSPRPARQIPSPEILSLQISLSKSPVEDSPLPPTTKLSILSSSDLDTLLLAAVTFNNIPATTTLLSLGANPGVRGAGNRTLLHIAAYGGKPKLVDLLLRTGGLDRDGAMRERDNVGARPFDRSLGMGERNLDVIESLIKAGALVEADRIAANDDTDDDDDESGDVHSDGARNVDGIERIEGLWSGFLQYYPFTTDCEQFMSRSTSIFFEALNKSERSFRGHGKAGKNRFLVRGQLLGKNGGRVVWLQLYKTQGWLYRGRIHYRETADGSQRKQVKGRWGSIPGRWCGDVEIEWNEAGDPTRHEREAVAEEDEHYRFGKVMWRGS